MAPVIRWMPVVTSVQQICDMMTALAFATKPSVKAQTEAVDPKAAANLGEDLDWRIAEQKKSADGWRTFLDARTAD